MAQDNRFDGLDRRIGELERGLRSIEGRLLPKDFPFPALAQLVTTTKEEKWLKRNAYWFSILSPALVAIGGLAGLYAGLFNSVLDRRFTARLNEPNGLSAQLQGLSAQFQKASTDIATANGELKTIRGLWENHLRKISELQPLEFQKALPQVGEALNAAATLQVNLPTQTTNAIQRNLLGASPQAPGYWPAVSQFVSFKSARQPGVESLHGRLSAGLAISCDSKAPTVKPPTAKEQSLEITFEDCVIVLDEPLGALPLNGFPLRIFGRSAVPGNKTLIFRRCIVKYSGGEIEGFLTGAILDNCLFVLSINTPPSHLGQEFIRALLNAGSTVKVPG